MRKSVRRYAVLVAWAALVLAGCGMRPAATPAPTAAIGCGTATTGELAVEMRDNAFVPFLDSLNSGETAAWINNDPVDHTVTFFTGPDCGTVRPGETVSAVMVGPPGVYRYHCTIHPSMNGEIRIL